MKLSQERVKGKKKLVGTEFLMYLLENEHWSCSKTRDLKINACNFCIETQKCQLNIGKPLLVRIVSLN